MPRLSNRSASLSARSSGPTEAGNLSGNQSASRQDAGPASSSGTSGKAKDAISRKPHSGSETRPKPLAVAKERGRLSVPQAGHPGRTPSAESIRSASFSTGLSQQQPDTRQQEDPQREKKRPRPAASSGQVPLMSDRQSAPSRQLGISGNKGNKTGEGRGGPGLVKKSRATATVVSGIPIAVHVKGKQQPGKSKSYSHASRLGSLGEDPIQHNTDSPTGREGSIVRYRVADEWKNVIVNYYHNLRNIETHPR